MGCWANFLTHFGGQVFGRNQIAFAQRITRSIDYAIAVGEPLTYAFIAEFRHDPAGKGKA